MIWFSLLLFHFRLWRCRISTSENHCSTVVIFFQYLTDRIIHMILLSNLSYLNFAPAEVKELLGTDICVNLPCFFSPFFCSVEYHFLSLTYSYCTDNEIRKQEKSRVTCGIYIFRNISTHLMKSEYESNHYFVIRIY